MRVIGRIIEFDERKGYGIIQYRNNSRLLLNASDILNYNAKEIRSTEKVSFEIERTPEGLRARKVLLLIIKPKGVVIEPKDSYLYSGNLDELDSEPALIRAHNELDDELGGQEGLSEGKASNQDFIAFALIGNKIRLVSLTEDGTYKFLDEEQNLHNILYVVTSETLLLQRAVEEFEYLINDPKLKENDFQNFFERNPDFLLNDEYKQAHPHVILSKDDGDRLIPDFVLEPIDQSTLCDLLELKLPSAEVFVLKKSRTRYSAAVYEAAAQLREYNRFFDEEKNRNNFQKAYPRLNAYRPRMFVIIGRRGKESPLIKRDIQSEFPNLILRTYDEILARMKWKAEKMMRRNISV